MGYIRGFTASVSVGGSAIKTLSDVSSTIDTEAIPVQTNGYDATRNVPGMGGTSYTFTVLAGTDPKVPGCVDGFSLLKGLAEAKTTFELTFSAGGASFSDNVFVQSFAVQNPINGLSAASVTCVPSAMDIVSGSGGSGGGTGSGAGS